LSLLCQLVNEVQHVLRQLLQAKLSGTTEKDVMCTRAHTHADSTLHSAVYVTTSAMGTDNPTRLHKGCEHVCVLQGGARVMASGAQGVGSLSL
jgi:hypothetical protein